MPLLNTSGNVTADAFGGGVAAVPNYIEECFSTFLYTGNGSTQTITNGIDLSGKGGMLWTKRRSTTQNHALLDTGSMYYAASNTTGAALDGSGVWSINSTGFGMVGYNVTNANNETYASWTFRKQPKFFDVVTYTGDDTAGRTIAHSLGSVPGCIIVKNITNGSANWYVYHQSLGNATRIFLNLTDASSASTNWNSTTPTSTVFTVGNGVGVNASGNTYVAYLFAHDAGGFGLTGTDNVISCGSFTTDSSGNATVNLGYEPQWVLIKNTQAAENWYQLDTMRGWVNNGSGGDKYLSPNLSSAEGSSYFGNPTATGFYMEAPAASNTYIYIAIRRGPMKVPTDGTSVFAPVTYTGNATARTLTTNFPVDLNTSFYRPGYSGNTYFYDRLRGSSLGGGLALLSSSTAAESGGSAFGFDNNVGIGLGTSAYNGTGETYINYMMRRAPSFFDEVCYTGTGSLYQVLGYNLGVDPELILIKNRSSSSNWSAIFPRSGGGFNGLPLNSNVGGLVAYSFSVLSTTQIRVLDDPHTVSGVSIGADNTSGNKYVAYLFATCPGVSKVGSYTGTGATQQINCGFTAGARFVLIKRTDSTGNWGVLDTARGMVSGTDPYLNLNTTAAEVNANNVYTTTGGFQLVSSDANFNANGGTYIFLAIA